MGTGGGAARGVRAGRSAELEPCVATADPFFLPYVQDWPLDAACPELAFRTEPRRGASTGQALARELAG